MKYDPYDPGIIRSMYHTIDGDSIRTVIIPYRGFKILVSVGFTEEERNKYDLIRIHNSKNTDVTSEFVSGSTSNQIRPYGLNLQVIFELINMVLTDEGGENESVETGVTG